MSTYQERFKLALQTALMKEKIFSDQMVKKGYNSVRDIAALLCMALKHFDAPPGTVPFNIIRVHVQQNGTDSQGQLLPSLVYGKTQRADIAAICIWLESGFTENQEEQFDYLTRWLNLYSQLIHMSLSAESMLKLSKDQLLASDMDESIKVLFGSILVQSAARGTYRYARFLNNTIRQTMVDKNAMVPKEILITSHENMEIVERYFILFRKKLAKQTKI